jgi:hypothetical protein
MAVYGLVGVVLILASFVGFFAFILRDPTDGTRYVEDWRFEVDRVGECSIEFRRLR